MRRRNGGGGSKSGPGENRIPVRRDFLGLSLARRRKATESQSALPQRERFRVRQTDVRVEFSDFCDPAFAQDHSVRAGEAEGAQDRSLVGGIATKIRLLFLLLDAMEAPALPFSLKRGLPKSRHRR